jgi:hypothetical protein
MREFEAAASAALQFVAVSATLEPQGGRALHRVAQDDSALGRRELI